MNLQAIATEKGYTEESLRAEILDRITMDGVRLGDFNEAQKASIISHYAAQVLSK